MRTTALIFLFICLPFLTMAQNTDTDEATVSGTVINPEGDPLPSASVAIYDTTTSTIIDGAATSKQGYFEIEVEPGSYMLKVTFVGYQNFQQPIEVSSGNVKSLGTITLNSSNGSLSTLFVRAQQSRMTLSFDKRVFHVGQDIVSLGGSALNVLNNVPSISTTIDGNISLRGNSSVSVLINGQPSNLVSDGVAGLRSIPASMIKQVEIITNPSAQYSAEGTGGIINIILKEKRELGFNGSAYIGGGYPTNFDAGTILNYRMDDINLFFGGSFDYRLSPEDGSSFVRLASPDTSYMYHEVTEQTEQEYDIDMRFGVNFFLTESSTLTGRVNLEYENGRDENEIDYTDYAYQQGAIYGEPGFGAIEELQRVDRNEIQDDIEKQIELNVHYVNKFGDNEDEHKLEAEIDFDIERESEDTNIKAVAEGAQVSNRYPIMQRINSNQERKDIRLDVDYKRPLGQHWRLETGLRANLDWLENSYKFENFQNQTWTEVPAYNNNYEFYDNTNAAYLTLGAEYGAFSGQIGLRLENTVRDITLFNTDNHIEQNYTHLFPSVFLNYSINKTHSIQISYSRRLDRPWPRLLLPFTEYSESRSRFIGNPELKPEFSNSFEAGYLLHWNTGSVLTSFYYRHRTGVIQRISLLDDQGFTRRIPINLSTEDAFGIEFSANQDFFDGLTLTANANFYTANSEGSYLTEDNNTLLFSSKYSTFQSRLGLRWNIGELWNLQTSVRYRGPRETAQGRRNASAELDMGFSRELFDRQAIISISGRNLLNAGGFDYTITEDGNPATTDYYAHDEFNWATRTISINFQYFFGDTRERGRN